MSRTPPQLNSQPDLTQLTLQKQSLPLEHLPHGHLEERVGLHRPEALDRLNAHIDTRTRNTHTNTNVNVDVELSKPPAYRSQSRTISWL